jgi:hypothetical protein
MILYLGVCCLAEAFRQMLIEMIPKLAQEGVVHDLNTFFLNYDNRLFNGI